MDNNKQLPFWQMLLLIALIMAAITFFSGVGLILTKVLYHFFTNGKIQKPTQPRSLPISIGRGIGEQRGENKRMLFTLN